jgi:archaellum biogenesis ATPase FlaH/5S rRNA maturation endonuclease (ribonuclease M5)
MNIQEYKQHMGQQAEHIIAQGMGLVRAGTKYRCPNKSAHKHGDRNPSMSWDSEALQFYCFTCGHKIDIYEYYKEHEGLSHAEIMEKAGGVPMPRQEKPKAAEKINVKYKPLMENQIKYLNSRGLADDTINHFKLYDEAGNIGIPYINNEKVLHGVKIKNMKTGDKYLSIKGSNFGLFNKLNLTHDKPLIITEGEFDSMIIHQAGFTNVSSVGSGANSLRKLFENEGEYLQSFKTLIIVADNDEKGREMKQAFFEKYGIKVKFPDYKLFGGLKDVNEVFLKYGEDKIKQIINSAAAKIEGLRNLDTNPYQGIDESKGRYISTGLPRIDYCLNDLMPGTLTLVTGRSNGGKSTLVNQVIANAINDSHKVFVVNGEGIPDLIINNLYKAVVGREEEYFNWKKVNKRRFKEPKAEVLEALRRWHYGKLTIFNKGDSNLKTTQELLEIVESEIKTQKYNLIVLDNLMSLISIEKASEKWERQADFVQRLCDLAKSENIAIILVLHPSKQLQKGSSMDFEHISGSSDIYNKADNIIAVRRNYEEMDIGQGIDGEIEILKNRYFPELKKIQVNYDKETGLLLEIDQETGHRWAYNFKWKQYLEGVQEELEIPKGFYPVEGVKW